MHMPALGQRLGDPPHGISIGVGPLQEATVAPEDIRTLIAGQVTEGVVAVDDGAVREIGIRQHHRHARELDRGAKGGWVDYTLAEDGTSRAGR